MSETPPINVGDKLGQFKLVELIAVGGMGHVYRGYDTALDRYVAVKILAPELASDPAIAARFLEEARAAAALNHVNVVHIYSAGQQAGAFYFVMELVNGQHLEALLNTQPPLTTRAAIDHIRQAALGLQHAHEHGLIHGDVKPANFLVAETGVLKVTDFGLARRVKAPPGSRDGDNAFGTPGYVSPEVINGQPPDHRSDIYSLGATFFHMLAGRPPFVGATPEETLARHLSEPAPPIQKFNTTLPAPVGQVIARMLTKEPAGRYQSYTDLIQALSRLGTEPRSKPSPRVGPRLGNEPPVAAPKAPVPAPKRESWVGVVFTLIAFIASIFILILVYKMKLADPPVAPPATNAVPAPRVISPSLRNREADAQADYLALKTAADAALSESRWGQALAEYAPWPAAKHAGTAAQVAVDVERKRIQNTAQQAWADSRDQIAALRADGKFAEALRVTEQLAQQAAGMPALLNEINQTRRSLVAAEREATAKVASEKAAADQARQVQVDQLVAQMPGYVTGFQWDKGLAEIKQALAEISPDAPPALLDWQAELTSLVALRTGVAERLKAKPSAVISLATKRGEKPLQVYGVDAGGVLVRQTFGAAGFVETTIAWTELTPASACRVLMLNLDGNNADELFGYALLIAHQALLKQARIDDARKTLQVIAQRDPARALVVERYLTQLAQLEAEAVAPPRPNEPESPRNIDRPVGKGCVPFDLSGACNASFFEHENAVGDLDDFGRKARFTGLPADGRVPVREADGGGMFQLRHGDQPDSIGLTWANGRFPNSATFKLPVAQQRRYARLAILSASSVGAAIVKARLTYDNGETSEAKLRIYDWANPPAGIRAALDLPVADSTVVRHMFVDVIEVDPKQSLTAITFTWVSTTTEHPQHCAGIFAVSGLPADAAR